MVVAIEPKSEIKGVTICSIHWTCAASTNAEFHKNHGIVA